MVKYGNMSGWKAIRTFNRDARVNDGLPPYSYKSRYANPRRNQRKKSHSTEQILKEINKKNSDLLPSIWGVITVAEQAEVNTHISASREVMEAAELEWRKAEFAFFFREAKISAFNSTWPPRFVIFAQELNNKLVELQRRANFRLSKIEKAEKSLNRIISKFDKLIGNSFEFLENPYVNTIEDAKKRYAKACGGRIMRNGTINVPVENWEDHLKRANNYVLFLEALKEFVEKNEPIFLNKGVEIVVNVEKLLVSIGGKNIHLHIPKGV
jgi:hypothetical protein